MTWVVPSGMLIEKAMLSCGCGVVLSVFVTSDQSVTALPRQGETPRTR